MRNKLHLLLKLAALFLALALAVVSLLLWWLAPKLRDELEATLSAKTGQPVRLQRLSWSLLPRIRFQGRQLRVGEQDGPWMASVGEFEVEAGLTDLLGSPRTIERIVLADTLVVTGPRRDRPPAPQPERGETDAGPQPAPAPEKQAPPPLLIREVSVSGLLWKRRSGQNDRPPQELLIRSLRLSSFDLTRPVPFQAALRYGRPPGELELQGEFGPWNGQDPSATPYRASYRFREADLSVFGGIRGILDSTGSFEGRVEDTRVSGQADIPDFTLTKPNSVVPLHNRFQVAVQQRGRRIVLEEVVTDFLDSRLVCRGEIFASPDSPGRTVSLRVEGRQARVEDLIRFGSSSENPPLTGAIDLDASVLIPPGAARFRERMTVEGGFQIAEGRFTNVSIQDTLAKISRAGGGEGAAEEGSSVVSNMSGSFVLNKGLLDFSRLVFEVPGVRMDLTGSYRFDGEVLDFRGDALLERAPSDLASGRVGDWIKLIDPIFRKGKFGTSLPVTIRGTRSRPVFRVDLRRIGRGG